MMYMETPGAPSRTMTSPAGNSAVFRQLASLVRLSAPSSPKSLTFLRNCATCSDSVLTADINLISPGSYPAGNDHFVNTPPQTTHHPPGGLWEFSPKDTQSKQGFLGGFSLSKLFFPSHDLGDIAFLLSIFDATLGVVNHGKTGVGKNVVAVDFDEAFCSFCSFVKAAMVEESHAEPMKGILVF